VAQLGEAVQRVGLPSRPVERAQVDGAQALPQWMPGH
jgi:hypothetical protein